MVVVTLVAFCLLAIRSLLPDIDFETKLTFPSDAEAERFRVWQGHAKDVIDELLGCLVGLAGGIIAETVVERAGRADQ